MDPLRAVVETAGFFTRGQARDLAYDDKAVAAAVRGRVWHRIRRGYFTFHDIWVAADDVARHRIRSRCVAHSLGDAVALSHVSAVVEHGIDVWGVALGRIHVTRLDGGAGRVEGDVVHHEGLSFGGDVVTVGGLSTTKPERAVLEMGSRARGAAKLVALDSMLHLGAGTPEGLYDQFRLMQRWPFMQSMHVPIRMADARSASAGETLGRHLFRGAGLPAPELQFAVRDADGHLIGICDWAWPGHGLLGEFDGRVKYGRLLLPGQQPGDVVFAEKLREDALREATGHRMIRLVWDDYDHPTATVARLRRMLRQVG